MRTEAILLIRCNCFEMWWPGTELNRRRQPFQGCALPPELPGHFLSAHRLTADLAVHWALSLGGKPRSKQPMRWDRAELLNYNNAVPFAQNGCRRFSPRFFCHDERWPLGTPFMIVSTQRFAPNQYGISR